ncbi:TonB-dependent receptor [bacterium]|nr:TonB-dependent receptor [bacterium]MBU1958352.1 TonB-dependent receptor [bacterium]
MNTTIKLSLFTTLLLNTNLIADEKLEDISVSSATKTTQKIQDVTSNIDVITAQEIEERHYTTVTEALNSLAGISFTSNGGLGQTTSLRLRGMDSKHTLILVDGVRYQDPSNTTGALIEHLMITDIEKIEVIKGAQSGIWGADATAGVVNIITKQAKEGINFYASQEYGSFNTSHLKSALSYQNKNFYIKTNYTQLNSSGFTTKVPKGEALNQFEDDGYTNKTASIQAGIHLFENGKLDVGHTSIDGLAQYDTSSPNDENMKSDINTKLSHINYVHQINNHRIALKHEISDFTREEIGTVGSPWGENVKNFNGKITNSELTDTVQYLENDFLMVGAGHQTTTVDYVNTATATNKDKYSNKGIFVTNSNKLATNTIVTESLRYDKYDHFDNKTTGKIGIKHPTNFGLVIGANYGTAYNTPSIIEILNPWGASNLNLQPEEIKSYDVNLGYKNLTLSYFNQEIDNLIAWDNGGYDNIEGTSKIKGYEIAYNTTLFDEVVLGANYTNLDAKDKNGQDLKRRPKESIKVAIDYYGIENLHLGINGEYIGKRDDLRFNPDYSTTDINTGNYTIANFTANYEVDKHMSLYGKVDNITDKYYQTVEGYVTSPRAVYAGMKLTY